MYQIYLSRSRYFFNRYWILILLIMIKFVLQFVLVNPVYELHRDEFLHLDQAFHPAAGYISVPPFTSWIASLIYLFGGGIFWIRFFPALFGALTIVFAWLIAEETGGRLGAKIFTAVSLIFSVLVRMNVLLQPNSFDILAWTIIFYLLIRYVNTGNVKWLMLLSVITALGFYNKYNVVFLLAGLFTGLLVTRQRTIFTKRFFYIALSFSVVLILPNIIWQIKNHFPVIHHMEALSKSQLVNIKHIDFLKDQVKFGLTGLLTLAAFWAFIFYKPFRQYRFIGWTFIVTLALFTLLRAKNYYSVGLYPVMFALGSVYLESLLKKAGTAVFSLLAAVNIVIFFLLANYLMPLRSPSEIMPHLKSYEKMGLLRWEDGKNHLLPQDFADMQGWREMADKALQAYKMIPVNELDKTLIYCDNYGQTGALNYYDRSKMPKAYSGITDYIFWMPRLKEIRNIVYVGKLPKHEFVEMFDTLRIVGTVENEFAREKGTTIFLLLGGSHEVTEDFYKYAEERKRNFKIF